MWKIESVILTRRIPKLSPSAADIPWSLSPLQHHYAPDDSRFWFLNYGTNLKDLGSLRIWISGVYAGDQWDIAAHQLRVLPVPREYLGIGGFRCVDGLVELQVQSIHDPSPMQSQRGMLLVGRASDSRRDLYIKPWCKFVEGASMENAASFIESFGRDIGFEDCGAESTVELKFRRWKVAVKTTVQTKEISGVFYHVVGTRPIENDRSDRELSLHEPLRRWNSSYSHYKEKSAASLNSGFNEG